MKTREVLVPIDIAACPFEVFSFVNEYANNAAAKVTLLHVSRLNVASPENRLYLEVENEIQALLLQLQAAFVNPNIDANVCVRTGKPAEEIVAQAASMKSDMIVLSCHSNHRRRGLFKTDVVKQVIAAAPCPVCVLQAETQLDCRSPWSSIEGEPLALDLAPDIVRPMWPPFAPI
jgi:nucleotide-binding universal stress UspA family protein